jgi:hypothetical protein
MDLARQRAHDVMSMRLAVRHPDPDAHRKPAPQAAPAPEDPKPAASPVAVSSPEAPAVAAGDSPQASPDAPAAVAERVEHAQVAVGKRVTLQREAFPDEHELDSSLLRRADQEVPLPETPLQEKLHWHSRRTTALTSQGAESQQARAARYFAMHGMEKVGHLLDDEPSPKDLSRAVQEGQQQHAFSATGEEDLVGYKSAWKAVDALRRRAARHRW